jgi:hypothetical protein
MTNRQIELSKYKRNRVTPAVVQRAAGSQAADAEKSS